MNDTNIEKPIFSCCSKSDSCCEYTTLGDEDRELAQLAKALAHPARVAILRLLLARTECICGEICGEIPLAQSTISQHLKMMKEAGLIQGEVDGSRICYCVNRKHLARLKALILQL
ncbi:MAG: metalloregulator ArsR/SmtB family transcription factor [bacterium]